MATRNEFDDFFGDDEELPIADTRADGRLYRVPLGRLTPNLVNPRTDFGTEDQLIDFGKSLARRQNQPCPVVSRGAYLKLWPDHAAKMGDVDYVLVSGERRYRAATAVGLPGLDCVANDDFARDRRTFMEAVVSENVDRQNFDPIEEAYAVQALVAEFGSNRAVAQHFERVDGWVTQRVLLTHLARQVQDLVRAKAMPLEAARTLGKQARDHGWDVGQQLAWWQAEQEQRSAASAARAAARKAVQTSPDAVQKASVPAPTVPPPAQDQPESFTAVKPEPVPGPRSSTPTSAEQSTVLAAQSAVVDGAAASAERQSSIPDPRDDSPAPSGDEEQARAPKPFPYDDPGTAVLLCHQKMSHDAFVAGGKMWMKVMREEYPDDYRRLITETADL